jgi:hypothetical protein
LYVVTVHWMSNNPLLSSLVVRNAAAPLVPSFLPLQSVYTLQLAHDESENSIVWSFEHSASSASVVLVEGGVELPVALSSNNETVPLNWQVGDTTVRIVSRAEDGIGNATYLLFVHRRSNDTSLAMLICPDTLINTTHIDEGNFRSAVRAAQRGGVIACMAMANHPAAFVEYRLTAGSATSGGGVWSPVSSQSPWSTDTLLMEFESNVIEFRVTSEEGNWNIFTLDLFVQSDDASLASLQPTNSSWPALQPTFHSAISEYTLALSNQQDTLALTAVRSHSRANYSYSFSIVDEFNPTAAPMPVFVDDLFSSSNETAPLPLPEGDSLLFIHVVSEDGSAERTYTVRVHRISAISSLAALSCSACGDRGTDNRPSQPAGSGSPRAVGLQPLFHNATLAYSLISPAALSSLSFVAFPTRLSSTVVAELNGELVAAPARGSSPLLMDIGPLLFGDNTLLLTVRSEVGDTTTVYNVSIYRLSADGVVAICVPDATPVDQQPANWEPEYSEHRFVFASNVSAIALSLAPRSNLARSLDYSFDAGVHWINATRTVDAVGDVSFFLPNVSLPIGASMLRVLVQAEDDTARFYTLRLYRLNADTTLVQFDCQPLMAPLPIEQIDTTDLAVTQHQMAAVAPPNTATLRCLMVPASAASTMQLCQYGDATALPLADAQCQSILSGESSADLPLINFGTVLLEARITSEDHSSRSYFVRVHVPSDDRRLSWLTVELDGVARQLAPPFNPAQNSYRVFIDRDDNPSIDSMQWPSVVMAAAVQPTSNISVLGNDGALQPLVLAAASIVNTSSILQLRVTSEIGTTNEIQVSVHPVSHLMFRCVGSRNLSDLVPAGVESMSPMDCLVQTPSGAKPVGGDITLRLQILAEDGTWLSDVATLKAESDTPIWSGVPFDSPSIAAAGKSFTVGFALTGSAAHQFIAPPNVSFAFLEVPLLSMLHRGVSGTGGPVGIFASVQPPLHAGERYYSSVLGDTYDMLELHFRMHAFDGLTVFHENDAFAALQNVDDEWRRQIVFGHDPSLLMMSRHGNPGDAQSLNAPNSTLLVRMLPGQNQLKLCWDKWRCTFGTGQMWRCRRRKLCCTIHRSIVMSCREPRYGWARSCCHWIRSHGWRIWALNGARRRILSCSSSEVHALVLLRRAIPIARPWPHLLLASCGLMAQCFRSQAATLSLCW